MVPVITKYPIPVSNRFIPFVNCEPQENKPGISPHKTGQPLPCPMAWKHKNFKETQKKIPSYGYRHQATKNDEEQYIPTIMNGKICDNISERFGFTNNNDINAFHERIGSLSRSINESNRNITALDKKHKVILIGDSHIRGYGGNLISILSKNYEIYSIVKPGSNSNELNASAKKEINCLTDNDIVVIGYGSNDYECNEFPKTLMNILSFIQSNSHTNIVVLNVPFRYDLPNANLVNNSIVTLNRKIKKIIKAFPHANVIEIDNDRKLFTNHGFHRNKSGKLLAIHLLALSIQAFFEQKVLSPIPLYWYNKLQVNVKPKHEGEVKKVHIRNSNRNKKLPITRSSDFLWET
jgi:hypothetical protein